MYENIVVGFDGSEHSKSALNEVSNWIRRHGGNAVLVHAVFFDEEEYGTIPDLLEKRMDIGRTMCFQAQEEISSALGINFESIICEGDPPDTIVEIAETKKADLIAIGTHGRKGITKLLMGSVTSGVLAHSPCDVLVVRKSCPVGKERYGSILVPFDGSEFSKKALLQACRIAKIDGGNVTVLYVVPRYQEMIEFYMTSSIKNSLTKEAEKITAVAASLSLENGVHAKLLIDYGDIGSRIAETASKEKNDLIVMGSRGWNSINKIVMGSSTERTIMFANCPILVVK